MSANPILVSLHGPDHPGISAGLMGVFSEHGAEIYDVEQIVVRGMLTLNVLVGGGGAALEEAVGRFAAGEGLHVSFEEVVTAATEPRSLYAVTVIGSPVTADDFGAVANAIAAGGGNIERIFRLSRYPVVSYELAVSTETIDLMRRLLMEVAAARPIDLAIQPEGLERRAKRVVIMDVDSTLTETEVIDLLAAEAGVEERVSRITAAAMAGEVPFEESLRQRVALLEGLDEAALDRVAAKVKLTPGARTFVRTLKRLGMTTAIVSAGFTRFTTSLAADLGIDYSLSNTLDVKGGVLTGRLAGELVDGPRKARFLAEVAEAEGVSTNQVVAIGDGANDLDMLAAAGLGIAFNGKPVVKARADTSVSVPYLDAILFLLGVKREHVEAADARDDRFEQPPLIEVPGTPPI